MGVECALAHPKNIGGFTRGQLAHEFDRDTVLASSRRK